MGTDRGLRGRVWLDTLRVRGRDIDGIRTERKLIGNLYQIPSGFFATVLLCFHNTHYGNRKLPPKSFIVHKKLKHHDKIILLQNARTLTNTGFYL